MAAVINGKVLPKAPDYPVDNAGWYPLHPDRKSNYGVATSIQAICLHSPEEPADNYESTPVFFSQSKANGSVGGTHYYTDNDGDIVQMARDTDQVHAQGVSSANARLPRPDWWLSKYISYNTCMLSNEIEGYASTLHKTMPIDSKQWNAVVAWCAYKYLQYKLPMDELEKRIIGHGQLAKDRTDPGPQFPWAELHRQVRQEIAHMAGRETSNSGGRLYTVRSGDTLGGIAIRLGVNVDELARVNRLDNPNLIRVGQVLTIPTTPTVKPNPDSPRPHPMLTEEELINAFVVLLGYAPAPQGNIKGVQIQATFETSGQYKVYRLLIKD